MPDQLRTSRVTGNTLGSELPLRISELETAISVITGIPIDLVINNPLTAVLADGIRRVFFQDLGGLPATNGELARLGPILGYNNGGSAIKTIPLHQINVGEIVVENTIAEVGLYNEHIEAGFLGLAGMIEGSVLVLINSMLSGSVLSLKFYWGGVLMFTLPVTNQTPNQHTGFGAWLKFRIHNRTSAAAQAVFVQGGIPVIDSALHVSGNEIFERSEIRGAAANTALIQSVQVNAAWSVQSSSNSCQGFGFSMKRLS
jgi:hypothetical protein